MQGHKGSLRPTEPALYAVGRYVILPQRANTDAHRTVMQATMRQRADTNIQRPSAHAAIFAKQLAMTCVHLGNGCTQPLPLTKPTDHRTCESDDVAFF